jgi:transposase
VWKRQLEADGVQAFSGNGRLKEDEAVIRRMQREIEVLKQERDILKKALAIFSQEQP